MKSIIQLLLICLFSPLFSQEKGLSPTITKTELQNGETYAVVVGISDYQNDGIPDLKYAHKDAEAFAAYLSSEAGGKLQQDHIKVLINEKATLGAFASALDWLWEEVKENDKVFIYFSGHGDVERKSLTQPGFLLCWDAPPKNYMAGGAFFLPMLQEVISTLSLQNKAKVIVITDACRSGKLSGSTVGGSNLTNASLAKTYSNELKILSCQPNEFSIEGEQWGGGRGAFSFHLLNALYGMADANGDSQINLKEIGRYIEDNVSMEVSPQQQNPMILGNKLEDISSVVPEILAQIKLGLDNQSLTFASVELKGNDDFLLNNLDTNITKLYTAFNNALDKKQFLRPENDCADYYYNLLLQEPEIKSLHNSLKRNYTVALQDDAQQSINAILSQDEREVLRSRGQIYKQYKDFPKLLNRAAELLGESHYMYQSLKARENLFEGILLYMKYAEANNKTLEAGTEILTFLNKSILLEPESAVAHYFMSFCYAEMMKDKEKTIYHAEQALILNNSWIDAYIHASHLLSKDFKDFEKAKVYLDEAMKIDSLNAGVWKAYTSYYLYNRDFSEALKKAEYVAKIAPEDPYAWLNLGAININMRNYPAADSSLIQSLKIDSNQEVAYYYLGLTHQLWGKDSTAEVYFLKSIDLSPEAIQPRSNLANFYFNKKRFSEAESQYIELLKYTDPDAKILYNIAVTYAQLSLEEKALEYIDKALINGFNDINKIENESIFQKGNLKSKIDILIKKHAKN